jgi:hypothetical protein
MPQHTDKPTTAPLVEWVFSLAVAASVAALWVGLFKFNSIFFEYLGVSQYISWVFLPAAIRMISVMLFDWVGAAGLFVGAVITSDPVLNHNFRMQSPWLECPLWDRCLRSRFVLNG